MESAVPVDLSLAEHPNDTPDEKINAEGAIDPSFVAPPTIEDDSRTSSTPDDDKSLKKTWLTLLPTEQVIEIVMKLDEFVPRSVRKEVWPVDLKTAVFQVAVAKLMESSDNGNAHDVLASLEPSTISRGKKAADAAQNEEARSEGMNAPPSSIATTLVESSHSSKTTPVNANATIPAPVPLPATTPVPTLTPSVPQPSPATSTTTYQAASSSYVYHYPYASGSYSYQHPTHQQPYSFSYSSSNGSTSHSPAPPPPPSIPSAPGSIPITEDDDDLPSYEEMLVQALTMHNDPSGTAPKQLFQWMAATYPLQANFRPSASQALQKAYKRGRFEKNSEGKYRLNPRWEGGNTSRRTTRRPQSYSKAVTNPSPSSHPPTNPSQYPPQHYTWTYGNGKFARAQSHSQSPAPPTPAPLAPSSMKNRLHPENTASSQADADQENHRSCMEAAYSILQALNVTSTLSDARTGEQVANALPQADNIEAHASVSAESAAMSSGNDNLPPVIAGDFSLPIFSSTAGPGTSALSIAQRIETSAPGGHPAAPQSLTSNRAALQGSLALLAAQLAELADSAIGQTQVGVASSLSEPSAPGGTSTGSDFGTLNILEGVGLDLFSSGSWAGSLHSVDISAKR